MADYDKAITEELMDCDSEFVQKQYYKICGRAPWLSHNQAAGLIDNLVGDELEKKFPEFESWKLRNKVFEKYLKAEDAKTFFNLGEHEKVLNSGKRQTVRWVRLQSPLPCRGSDKADKRNIMAIMNKASGLARQWHRAWKDLDENPGDPFKHKRRKIGEIKTEIKDAGFEAVEKYGMPSFVRKKLDDGHYIFASPHNDPEYGRFENDEFVKVDL